jgi:hypothetical protein
MANRGRPRKVQVLPPEKIVKEEKKEVQANVVDILGDLISDDTEDDLLSPPTVIDTKEKEDPTPKKTAAEIVEVATTITSELDINDPLDAQLISKRKMDERAAKERELRKLPKLPADGMKFEGVCNYLRSLSELQWEGVMVYIYRVWPEINREPKYIGKIGNPTECSYNYMLTNFGGGKYKWEVASTGPNPARIVSTTLDISIADAEPILDYNELVMDAPKNRTYIEGLVNKGILGRDKKPKPAGDVVSQTTGSITEQMLEQNRQLTNRLIDVATRQPQQQQLIRTNEPADQVVNKSIDIISRGYDAVMQRVLKDSSSNTDPLQMITTIMGLVREMQPTKSNNDAELYRQMLDMQAKNHQAQLELMKVMMESKKSEENNESKLTEMLKSIMEARESKKAWYESALQYAPMIFRELGGLLTGFASLKGGGAININPGVQQAAGPMTNQPQGTMHGGLLIPSSSANQINNPPTNLDPLTGEQIPQTEEEKKMMDKQRAKLVIQQAGAPLLNFILQGKSGDELADTIYSMYGAGAYAQIAGIGEENLVQAIKDTPEIWNQLQFMGESKIRGFVQQFLKYPEMLQQEGQQGGDEQVEDD